MNLKALPSSLALVMLAVAGSVLANMGPIPMSLKGVPVPTAPGLFDGPAPVIVDRQAALALGKALFWDSNVGSDGMACASCHFQAGADGRTRHQLAPNGRHGGAREFSIGSDGLPRGVNQVLRASDFPFTQSNTPLTETEVAGFARTSDDVVGSAGTFGGNFSSVHPLLGRDDGCQRTADATFQLGGIGTRRVISRNAPTVINAVFNHRQLWDGRASNSFNGVNHLGPRDPAAGVWVVQSDGSVKREAMALSNSSLASQAVTAPLSDVEMACKGRTLADIGRKLLFRAALDAQVVHPQDSVLGPLSVSARDGGLLPGLTTEYLSLVQRAFHPRFWSYRFRGAFGKPASTAGGFMNQAYSQTEANFALFFGLALQVYQSTLVSDDAPFDRSARDAQGLPVELSPSAQRGLQQFRTGHCALCHIGPAFTAAAVDTNAALVSSHPTAFGGAGFRNTTSRNVVARMPANKGFGLVDTGFAATGVGQDTWDLGLAGKDESGMDISLASQFLQLLAGNPAAVKDPRVLEVRPCDLPNALALNQNRTNRNYFIASDGLQLQPQPLSNCLMPSFAYIPTPAAAVAELARPDNKKMLLATDAAFKIPTLRNVELTGPYMHNGSMASLDQVIEFYARGGNFNGVSKQFGTVFGQANLQLDPQARADLKAFLESLTDERVRYERAPFDHPELRVPHGHTGDRTRTTANNPLALTLAADDWLVVPAVGAAGRGTPLQPFHTRLEP